MKFAGLLEYGSQQVWGNWVIDYIAEADLAVCVEQVLTDLVVGSRRVTETA